MSVDLARRLVQGELIPADPLEAALKDWATGEKPLVRALAERSPELTPVIDTVLDQRGGPSIKRVRGVSEIVSQLPRGMCQALLALPIRRDLRTGTVDVATVDISDAHLAAEFEHHLRAPVRLVRASLADLLSALRELKGQPDARNVERTPAFGTPVARPAQALAPRVSQPPPSPPPKAASEPPATQDYARGNIRGGSGVVPQLRAAEVSESGPSSEPVLELTRPKVDKSGPKDAAKHLVVSDAELSSALEGFAHAESLDDVVDQLVRAMRRLARQVVIFAARGSDFNGRAGEGVDESALLSVRIPVGSPNVLSTAAQAGYYLGPLPETAVHAELRSLLRSTDEVSVSAVLVSDRPVLLVLLAGIGDAFSVTRRADQLARSAGRALETIVRKRQKPVE